MTSEQTYNNEDRSAQGRRYRIRNWRKYQHYGKRSPPWIKLHTKILHSQDWVRASDSTKLTMVCCLLVGSMNDGWLPDDSRWVKDACHIDWRVNFKPLIECGFLEDMLADASTKTETEERQRRDREEKIPANAGSATKKYAFESGVIRLTAKDLEAWKARFSYLDVPAELGGLSEFAQNNAEKWFFACQGALAKRNREVKASRENGNRETDKERRKREYREARAQLRAFGEGRNNGDFGGSTVRLLSGTGIGGGSEDVYGGGGESVLPVSRGNYPESG